jgi:hypothetical protein
MPSALVEKADAERFQQWIHRQQYPADCSQTAALLTRAGVQADGQHYPGDYFYGLGLGSQMASLKYNLVHALLRGRVYHFPTSHYVNPVRCPSQTFDCYFEAPTNCSRPAGASVSHTGGSTGTSTGGTARRVPATHHRSVETAQLLWCFELPRKRLSRLAGLRAVHPEAWYQAQLAAFLFRPNEQLQAFRAALLPTLAYDTNRTRAAALSQQPGGLHNGSCVSIHIRRTDKFRGRRREDRRSAVGFDGFARAYKSWVHWSSSAPLSHLRVLLGSEDPLTFRAMPPLLAPTVAYWIPGKHFVMASFKDITDNNNKLVGRYAALQKRMAAARVAGPAEVQRLVDAGATKDEGMALILQMLMMAECEAFIGSYASNVAILVHDLMLARKTSKGESLHAVDVNGRTYCGCGASFCMKLERRGTREPRRSMRNMIEAFRGSNINAI